MVRTDWHSYMVVTYRASYSELLDGCQEFKLPSKAPIVSLTKKLLSLLSTGWFQEQIQTRFTQSELLVPHLALKY